MYLSRHITDAQNAPIAYASVAVYDDTKAVAGTITDDNGKFMLKVPVSTDGYELAVEFIGYTRHTGNIKSIEVITNTDAGKRHEPRKFFVQLSGFMLLFSQSLIVSEYFMLSFLSLLRVSP